jgi:hypothetical protein
MAVAFRGVMNKKPKPNKSSPTTHPETQHSRPKSGTPGTESSKAKGGAQDARTAHDKDGNGQQRGR